MTFFPPCTPTMMLHVFWYCMCAIRKVRWNSFLDTTLLSGAVRARAPMPRGEHTAEDDRCAKAVASPPLAPFRTALISLTPPTPCAGRRLVSSLYHSPSLLYYLHDQTLTTKTDRKIIDPDVIPRPLRGRPVRAAPAAVPGCPLQPV